ncbi:beta-lactamase family protein [Candidatus Sumerlaeota bacterium]|nr:beta-lactamase family protein [Candidatus Sumerlaeota bacterium]
MFNERSLQWLGVSIIGIMFFAGISGCQLVRRIQNTMTRIITPTKLNPDHLIKIKSIVEDAINNKVTPGAVVIIGTPTKTYYQQAFGRLTYDENSPPMTTKTIFDMASVSKVVGTATATMLLIQDGRLSLTDPVSKFIPEFATPEKAKITIYHLLTHTSGLAAYTSVNKVKATADPELPAHENLIRFISKMPLKYKTGKGYTYSCLNYLTLAYINQKILGYNQDTFLKERVYKPLGMLDTTYFLTPEQKKRSAPTIKSATEFRQGEVHDPLAHYSISKAYAPGNAGLFSTAEDLEKYCRMILNRGTYNGKEILKPDVVHLMTTVQTPPAVEEKRAIGFDVWETFPWSTPLNQKIGREVVGHTGYTGTLIRIDKYAGNYLILLTNRVYPNDKAKVTPLRKAIMRVLLESCPLYKDIVAKQPETK